MTWHLMLVGDERLEVKLPEIVGKQRPRTAARGKHVRVYTPRKTRLFEDRIRKAWRKQVGCGWATFAGPVIVTILIGRELAKSNPKRWAGRLDLGKPDADNVAKAVLDALNGLAYADDSQVFRLIVEKLPRTPHGTGNRVLVRCIYYAEEFEKE